MLYVFAYHYLMEPLSCLKLLKSAFLGFAEIKRKFFRQDFVEFIWCLLSVGCRPIHSPFVDLKLNSESIFFVIFTIRSLMLSRILQLQFSSRSSIILPSFLFISRIPLGHLLVHFNCLSCQIAVPNTQHPHYNTILLNANFLTMLHRHVLTLSTLLCIELSFYCNLYVMLT